MGLRIPRRPQTQTSTRHLGLRCLGHRESTGLEGDLGVLMYEGSVQSAVTDSCPPASLPKVPAPATAQGQPGCGVRAVPATGPTCSVQHNCCLVSICPLPCIHLSDVSWSSWSNTRPVWVCWPGSRHRQNPNPAHPAASHYTAPVGPPRVALSHLSPGSAPITIQLGILVPLPL